MNNNKGLANSIMILACTIVVGSSIIALKLPVTINLPSIETKESYQVLRIDEAADYLRLSEEQIIRMINIERRTLEKDGVFSGIMFPYFKVDDEYYFSKAQLDEWIKEAAIEQVEYHTSEGWMK